MKTKKSGAPTMRWAVRARPAVTRAAFIALVFTSVGCSSYEGQLVEEEVAVGEVEQGLFSSCDWTNAPTNGTIALQPGIRTLALPVLPPYGSPSCPNQVNVAVTNTTSRSYVYQVVPVGVGQSDCASFRMDTRQARKPQFCLPGNPNCWHDRGTITTRGVWVANTDSGIPECALFYDSGSGTPTAPAGKFPYARVNARAYNVSTNINLPNVGLVVRIYTTN
jgi:hypothetical protein